MPSDESGMLKQQGCWVSIESTDQPYNFPVMTMNYLDFCEFTLTILQGEGNIKTEMRLAPCHWFLPLTILSAFERSNM